MVSGDSGRDAGTLRASKFGRLAVLWCPISRLAWRTCGHRAQQTCNTSSRARRVSSVRSRRLMSISPVTHQWFAGFFRSLPATTTVLHVGCIDCCIRPVGMVDSPANAEGEGPYNSLSTTRDA